MNIALFSVTPLRHFKEATTITIVQLAKELQERGNTVMVFAQYGENLPHVDNAKGIKIYRVPKRMLLGKVFSCPLTLRKVEKRYEIKFDIIHSFSANPLFVISSFFGKLLSDAKIVHTLKSYARESSFTPYRILTLANAVTVPTKVFAKKVPKKSSVIYSSIDTKKFVPMDKVKLKKKYGFSGLVLFNYGSMHRFKGADVLIKALPLIKKEIPELNVIFAPRYAQVDTERQLVKEVGANSYTTFITDDINIVEFVNMADVLVLPYKSLIGTEGNPSCMLEAMACKTAVVTTDVPELREIVNHEEDVLLAKPDDVESLAFEVSRLLDNSSLQEKLRKNAYEKSKQFDIVTIADQFEEVYRQMLNS